MAWRGAPCFIFGFGCGGFSIQIIELIKYATMYIWPDYGREKGERPGRSGRNKKPQTSRMKFKRSRSGRPRLYSPDKHNARKTFFSGVSTGRDHFSMSLGGVQAKAQISQLRGRRENGGIIVNFWLIFILLCVHSL